MYISHHGVLPVSDIRNAGFAGYGRRMVKDSICTFYIMSPYVLFSRVIIYIDQQHGFFTRNLHGMETDIPDNPIIKYFLHVFTQQFIEFAGRNIIKIWDVFKGKVDVAHG
jgi:hypothetical protein